MVEVISITSIDFSVLPDRDILFGINLDLTEGMARILALLAIFLILHFPAQAQDQDTILMFRLNEVQFKSTRNWASHEERYRFNQTRYYVTTILPYVEAATKIFKEIDADLDNTSSRREKKKFVRQKEEELRAQFEDRIKDLNETQGVLLIKLIARQTGLNIYTILSDFKNPLTAMKWQAWARLNGFSIARKYDPSEEELLENVMISLGYPLPEFDDAASTAVVNASPKQY